ncbi:MAG: YMGG-like glycine zipper-containing protein [Novosphingobium sp.]
MINKLIPVVMLGSALALSGCARNYAGEGAAVGAVAGAAIGAATGGSVLGGAAIGGAVGAVGGSLIDKDGRCYHKDRYGRRHYDC